MEKVLHVVSLPHTQTTDEYMACAYTQKVVKFCKMMKRLGYKVFLYSGYQNEADCDEHVVVVPEESHRRWFGDNDFKSEFFKISWDPNNEVWLHTNAKVVHEMRSRLGERDFICLIAGRCQESIAEAFPNHISVEFGIGYEGVFSKFRVWESSAWMHYVYGMRHESDGALFDAVIPNYFDVNDFEFSSIKEDYVLFVGRFVRRKGLEIAVEATRDIAPLVMAGQGVSIDGNKFSGEDYAFTADHVTHVGHIDKYQRSDLMSRASAVIVPTIYIEPFGGVNVEAQLCGTPVITTDFGAFRETVEDGRTGFRCHTLGEFKNAITRVGGLDPSYIRDRAVSLYGLDHISYEYDKFFWRLCQLWDDGWYSDKAYRYPS